MKPTALNAVVALATNGNTDSLSKLAGNFAVSNPALQAALERKMNKAKDEAAEEAAESILGIIKSASDKVNGKLNEIRRLRATEKSLLKNIKQFNRAVAYGNETGNWLPLGIMTGDIDEYQIREEAGKKAMKIPDNWVPATEVKTNIDE